MGGEDPDQPGLSTGTFPHESGVIVHRIGTGDFHIYALYPTSWEFCHGLREPGAEHKALLPVGGSATAARTMPWARSARWSEAGAPSTAFAWGWINPAVKGLQDTWKTYGLAGRLSLDRGHARRTARFPRAASAPMTFSIVRSNPKVNGFNLTSMIDCWGAGEGIMDSFREFKPGHLAVLQAGWAPLRWCLLVNPTNVYADQPLRLRVALANEDVLPAGDYPALLKISGEAGRRLEEPGRRCMLSPARTRRWPTPSSTRMSTLPGLAEGTYTLEAELSGRANAAASELAFTVTRPPHAKSLGAVTVLGLDSKARDLLVRGGATIHDYAEGERIDREVILVGDSFKGRGGRLAGALRPVRARSPRRLPRPVGVPCRSRSQGGHAQMAGLGQKGMLDDAGLALPQGCCGQGGAGLCPASDQADDPGVL